MYKIVIWLNVDNNLTKKIGSEELQMISKMFNKDQKEWLGQKDVLVIGDGVRDLKWSDLKLNSEQLKLITPETQFIFSSHGGNGDNKQCVYNIMNQEGKLQEYDSLSLIKELIIENTTLHWTQKFAQNIPI